MSDYVYMRGKAQIKKEFISALSHRFKFSDDPGYLSWAELVELLPENILMTKAYSVLTDPSGRGDGYPGYFSSALPGFDDVDYVRTKGCSDVKNADRLTNLKRMEKGFPVPILEFNDKGELQFACASKLDKTANAFIDVLKDVSDAYYVLVDNRECAMEPWSCPIDLYRSEADVPF